MNPNNALESIKAPPSVSEVLKHEAEVTQANIQPPPLPQTSPPKPAKPKSLPPHSPEDPTIKQNLPARHDVDLVSPVVTNALNTKPISPHTEKPLPVKAPLKSALRNPSRTPSPISSTLRHPVASPQPSHRVSKISETLEDDSASVSSYETVHENPDSRPNSPVAPPVPPRDLVVNAGVDSDLSHGTTSTAIGSIDNGTSRRKSVRMSLPPTYSTTPPARYDWEAAKPPWSPPHDSIRADATWTSRGENLHERDIWEDSSDEDEGYSAARRLLSKLAGRH